MVGGQVVGQGVGGAVGHNAAVVDHQNPLAHRLDFRQDVGGENHRVVSPQVLDEGADLDDLLGVQAHGGLVQNEHRGIADECLGNAHALLVALGQVADEPVIHVLNLHQPADLLDVLLPGELCLFQVVHEVQVLFHRHVHVQGRLLGQVANLFFHLVGLLQGVLPGDGHLAGGGGKVTGDDVHRGGFARAVGSQEPDDGALLDFKTHAIQRQVLAVALGEVLDLYHVRDSSCFRLFAGGGLPGPSGVCNFTIVPQNGRICKSFPLWHHSFPNFTRAL